MKLVLAGLMALAALPGTLLQQPPPVPAATATLRVHPTNPRYFTDGSGRAIYLTGSHFWTTVQKWNQAKVLAHGPWGGGPGPGAFEDYIAFLKARNHNFTRLWVFEHYGFESTPSPWLRTGPGTAFDGGPKWNVAQVNPAYLKLLRNRVEQFRLNGIYVSVMFFRGNQGRGSHPTWDAHPFNPINNVNPELQTLTFNEYNGLGHPAALTRQQQYIAAVIDTLNDFDNLIWEIANEAPPQAYPWQQHLVDFVRRYEATKPKQHLVGITSSHPKDNVTLFRTSADWVSPGERGYDPNNPPPTDGRKIVISDTDHHLLERVTPSWPWRSFLRGEHPILMENELAWDLEAVRRAMGHTRAQAERMNLAAMTPRPDLAQTTFCLADPAAEYLVYAPDAGTFWVNLSGAPGTTFAVEWINPLTGAIVPAGGVLGGNRRQTFTAPFNESGAVLYLRSTGPVAAQS